jgi:hypothetical protein
MGKLSFISLRKSPIRHMGGQRHLVIARKFVESVQTCVFKMEEALATERMTLHFLNDIR